MSNTKQTKPKRLLSLLLTLVMVLSLLPTTAFATSNRVSTITGTVTGLTAPVCGAETGTIVPKFSFSEDSHARANIGSTSCWEKYDDYYERWYSQSSWALFTPGKWRYKQEILMNEGYALDPSSVSVKINEESWKTITFERHYDYCIAYSPEYTVSAGTAALSEARSGVAVTPVFDGYLNELNAQGKLSFQWMRKASGGSGFIQIPGATGSSYTPTDSDVGAIIYVAVWETERKVVTSSVVSNQVVVKASVGHTLNSVQASVTVPTVGASKEDCVPRLTTANMTIDHYNWYYTGSGDQTSLRSETFTTFEDDGNYLCLIYVKPNSTYAFADDATGMVNGKTAETQNGTDLVRLSYAVKVAKPPITSLSATGLPTLPAAGTKGEGVVNVPLTVTDPGYTATFTGWLYKATRGYGVMTTNHTFEAGETYFAEVMIVPVDGNLISTNATATVDGNTAVYTSGTVDGKRSYVVPFTVPNEAEETAYNITCVNCRVLNDKTTATAGTKLTFVSPSDTYGDGGVLSKWVVTVGDGEPTVVDGATQFALQYVMPGADLKMEAVYSKAVTFMDGENTIVKKTVDTTTNKVTSWPTNPTKEGYQFIGWYTRANGGIQKSQDAEFEADTTLYTHWDKVISTVKITEVTLPRVDVELSAAGAKSETAGIEVDSANGVWYYSTDGGATWTEVTSTLEANASDKYKFEVPFSIKDGYVLSASAGCSISYSKASIRLNGVRKYIATLECEASPASVTYIQFSGGYSIDGELKNESPIGGVPEGTNVTLTPTDLDICRENGLTDILNLLKGKHFAGWKSWDGSGYYVVDLTKNADGSVSFTMPTVAEQTGYSKGICIAQIWEDHSGGTATCTHQAICEDCGEAYGELAPNNHSDTKGVYSITSATHQLFCQDCGAAMEDAAMHEYGADNKCAACGYERSTTLYTVTVIDGSATPASATAGTTVTLKADEPADGMKFKEWVVVSGSVTINSDNTFTMPESNVVIMASYVPTKPAITTVTLPDGKVGDAYNQTLAATGTNPITWGIEAGNLPDGLTLVGDTIKGTPSKAGEFKFTVKATNSGGSDTKELTIKIADAEAAKYHNVTLTGAGTGATGAGSHAAGTTVNIYAGTKSGYTFNGWTSDNVTVLSASSKNASFVMPDKDVTVKANWVYNGGGGGGSYYAPVVPDMPMLYRGCTGDAVKTLQDKLNALGYNSGNVDGIFGAKTYAAVTAFQKANSLGVDGIVGKLTWGKLYGISPAMPVETTTVVGRPMVSYGSRGDAVRKLQELLNALGYDCGSVDGIFGSKTKAAVLAFQKANGLAADGIVGPLTWGKLV